MVADRNEEIHTLFVQDYNSGMDREALCSKYKIPENRFEDALAYLRKSGYALPGPIMAEVLAESGAKKNVPTSVYVIGVLHILYGGLMLVQTIFGMILFGATAGMEMNATGRMQQMEGIEHMKEAMSFVVGMTSLFGIYGIFLVVVAVYFIKLRAWARTTLEVVCWLRLAFVALLGCFFLFGLVMFFAAPGGALPQGVQLLSGTVMAINGVFLVGTAAALIIFLKYLRGRTIKEAVS